MKRTVFLTSAYDNRMEILVILLLLTFMDNNSELICKLRSALQFYRENRELIAMFQNASAKPAPPPESGEKCGEEKESRPSEGKIDSMKILEEYLKRSAV